MEMNEQEIEEIFLQEENKYKLENQEFPLVLVNSNWFYVNNFSSSKLITQEIEDEIKKVITETNLKEFIINFLIKYNNENSTYKNKAWYCGNGRRRSIGDIYKITLSYFPDVKLLDILNILYNECESKSINLCTLICPTINKRVYFKSESYCNERSRIDETDNFVKATASFTQPYFYAGGEGWVERLGNGIDEFGLKPSNYVKFMEYLKEKEYVEL